MKKITFIIIALITFSVSAQKKNKNGIIYDKHPAIDLIDSYNKAMADGDIEKAASMLHDDVSWYDGNTNDTRWGGKQRILNNIRWFKNYFDYVSFDRSDGAYPDAIEYKKDGNWVQSWVNVYGVHKNTGVELDHPVLRLYQLNNESSMITGIIEYSNKLNFNMIRNAQTDRENGKVYNSHKNINTARKFMYSFLNNDFDRAYSFWHKDAIIKNINLDWGTSLTLEQAIEGNAQLLKNFKLYAIDEIGYPDYIEYDYRNSKNVLSWWMMKFIRKSDGKKIDVPVHHSFDFDDDGKIISSWSYWNASLLE